MMFPSITCVIMQADLDKQLTRRAGLSKRRKVDDDEDITYINERNRHFNRKVYATRKSNYYIFRFHEPLMRIQRISRPLSSVAPLWTSLTHSHTTILQIPFLLMLFYTRFYLFYSIYICYGECHPFIMPRRPCGACQGW